VSELTWIRSRSCESHACVEVAFRAATACETANCIQVGAAPGRVYVRDSKDLTLPPLQFPPTAWRAFVAGVKDGDF
jgi:hypothetical protein